MRNRSALVGLMILAAATLALAQAGPAAPRHYNPATEITTSGTVEGITHPAGYNGMAGTHVSLKTQDGVLEVHLGPEAFLTRQNFSIAKGDTLTVTGSKQVLAGQNVLIAREVKKDDKVLTLRDANGIPKWSRRNSGNNQP